ncbi:hypothetical protein QTP86_030085 [Hemibagrus guttatus]|nr:hypothetical protein QTP86_030085 [Hemibagrus guttatus]
MFFSWFLSLSLILSSFASIHQVSGGEEANGEMRTEYPVPVVVRVTTETAEVYECVHGGDPENVNYTWYRYPPINNLEPPLPLIMGFGIVDAAGFPFSSVNSSS